MILLQGAVKYIHTGCWGLTLDSNFQNKDKVKTVMKSKSTVAAWGLGIPSRNFTNLTFKQGAMTGNWNRQLRSSTVITSGVCKHIKHLNRSHVFQTSCYPKHDTVCVNDPVRLLFEHLIAWWQFSNKATLQYVSGSLESTIAARNKISFECFWRRSWRKWVL